MHLQDQMRRIRHSRFRNKRNTSIKCFAVTMPTTALPEIFGHCGKCIVPWSVTGTKMLSSRSWKGEVWWKQFQQIKERFPLLQPKLHLPYRASQTLATPL